MPTATARASLMDDLDFVAALDKFDTQPVATSTATTSVRVQRSAPAALDDLDDVWESRAALYQPAPVSAPQPDWDGDAKPDYDMPPAIEERHVVRDVAGFLLMMALGGAAAVLVFHDRVALLLR